MSKLKSILLTGLSMVLVAALSIGGTLAYLQDEDSAVNVMTLGNVKIEQHEYERATKADGSYKTDTIDGVTSYVLQKFTQGKALLPIVGDPNEPGNSPAYAGFDNTVVRMTQVGSYGSMQVFAGKNAQDKFVTVKNTGKTAAYVRTLVAIECGTCDVGLIGKSSRSVTADKATSNTMPWIEYEIGKIVIDNNTYLLLEYVYRGASDVKRHENGILPAGDTTYPSLCQVYLKHNATNEDMVKLDGNKNGTLDIIVLSQAVQAAGFADADTALNTAFGDPAVEAAEWFGGIKATVLVSTVEEAQAAMKNSADVILIDCNAPAEDVEIPDEYAGTLTIENSKVNSIKANDTANIVINGDVVVESANGSAITAKVINISGNGNLIAIAADQVGAFGIGGMTTEKITINDVTIKNVVGGFDGEVGTDTKYYKNAPEGGSAIGSGFNGAEIVLNNVHIEKAIGGSKAAGIGARYHVGVNVTIIDSTIDYVEGGATAAAIGGSRVSGEATENGTTINITNSTITAKGGVYGAGIGSGYDTHCSAKQPLCTINITGSTINATGGQYAAGVGTGYHNAALAGVIKDSVINAVSGEKFYKATYTQAQNIGFGVVDPDREGAQTNSKLVCNGATIGIPEVNL